MMEDTTPGFLGIILGLLALYVVLWLYILLPARMAESRGRSVVGWVLLSLIFSPILACLLLWLLGNDPNRGGARL
jgi:hypothetical protein